MSTEKSVQERIHYTRKDERKKSSLKRERASERKKRKRVKGKEK